MKKGLRLLLVGLIFVLALSGCSNLGKEEVNTTIPQVEKLPEPISEDAEIIVPEVDKSSQVDTVDPQFFGNVHQELTRLAAAAWGLSSGRVDTMVSAAAEPDAVQANDYDYMQQWSHAYLWSSTGTWIWGDADDDFHDNIDQSTGEWESPEGYDNKSAKYYYERGNQDQGDWYVGYASHYITDVSFVLHASDPDLGGTMLNHHSDFERWINRNWSDGHLFVNPVSSDNYYFPIDDLKAAIRNASKGISYWTSSLGKDVWDAYAADGYPTGTGEGSDNLVNKTEQMLIRALRYNKGTVKYALDKYNQH